MRESQPKIHRATRATKRAVEWAWDTTDIAEMGDITVRLHSTDAPYRWHLNDGDGILVVDKKGSV